MPSLTTVYRWLQDSEEFREMYARAREDQADTLADEIVSIADEQKAALTAEGKPYDPDVNRDRLRVDARKWVAAKLKPRKYGDKVDIAHSGDVKVSVIDYGRNHNPS